MIDARLIDRIGRWIEQRAEAMGRDGPPVLGIAGSQGSGKSTLAKAIAERFGGASLSLDDVYLTKAERAAMAARARVVLPDPWAPTTAIRGGPTAVRDPVAIRRPIRSIIRGSAGPTFGQCWFSGRRTINPSRSSDTRI